MALLAVFTCALIWTSYGFRFSATPEPGSRLATEFIRLSIADDSAPSVRAALWLEQHKLLPQPLIVGFLGVYNAALSHRNYLLGEVRESGWWYYFPLAVLFKWPLATLAAGATALALVIVPRSRRGLREALQVDRWTLLCLVAPVLIYGGAAITSNLNHGERHLLPLYPMLAIGVGIIAARSMRLRPVATRIICCVLAVGLAVETLARFPNYIAFFNAPSHPWRLHLLGDSNLDWGQDLPLLAQWQEQHPGPPLYLAYFGSVNPQLYGIRYHNLPGGYVFGPPPEPIRGPCVIAISATIRQQIHGPPAMHAWQRILRDQQPREVLGGTIYLYDWQPSGQE
jgi:hypothetical protein